MKFAYAALSTVIAASLAGPLHADELTSAKKADIIKLLSINGTDRIVEPFAAIVTQSYMQSQNGCQGCSPKVPEIVREQTLSVMRTHLNGKGGLIERQVPIYQQRFSHAEIKELLAFYTSPIGHKMVAESGALTRDAVGASQEWARELGPEVRQRIDVALTKAGVKPAAPASPPPSLLQAPKK
jgi:hypothetical protein